MATITSTESYTTGPDVDRRQTQKVNLSNGTQYTIERGMDILTGAAFTKVWRQDFEGDVQRRSTLKAYRAEAGI